MSRFVRRQTSKIGLPPGSLIHVGDTRSDSISINVIDYDKDVFNELDIQRIEDSFPFKEKQSVSWINITGIHDTNIIEKIGTHFQIHPLVLEDILHTDQRPKYEEFEHFLFIIVKMLRYNEETKKIIPEQISFILTDSCVLSFQECEGDVFQSVRERIRNGKGRIRTMGADYLLYTLIDAIVDYYFVMLEQFGEHIERLDEIVIQNPDPDVLHDIQIVKREMIFLRKSIWPLREVINVLQKNDSSLINESIHVFFRDVYDHTIHIIDTIDSYRDLISGIMDIYMSSVSNKMNEVMKVLTIFAAIFIPLTFIAGIYGMNFTYMPELSFTWGYPVVWCIFLIVGLSMIFYFRYKSWF